MQSTISRFACRILVERNDPHKARIFAAGFDSSRNIFLGVSCWLLLTSALFHFSTRCLLTVFGWKFFSQRKREKNQRLTFSRFNDFNLNFALLKHFERMMETFFCFFENFCCSRGCKQAETRQGEGGKTPKEASMSPLGGVEFPRPYFSCSLRVKIFDIFMASLTVALWVPSLLRGSLKISMIPWDSSGNLRAAVWDELTKQFGLCCRSTKH